MKFKKKKKEVMLEIQTFVQKNVTKFLCGKFLLVNEKIMLMVGLDENQ